MSSIAKAGRLAGKVAIVTGLTVFSWDPHERANIVLQVVARAMVQA